MDSWELGVDDLQWTDQDLRTWLGDQSYLFDEALKTELDFLEVTPEKGGRPKPSCSIMALPFAWAWTMVKTSGVQKTAH